MGFLYEPSILQHLNIPAGAEDDVLAAVDADDFIFRAAGRASGFAFKSRAFRQGKVGCGCFCLGVGLAHDALKSQPEGKADDRKDGQ